MATLFNVLIIIEKSDPQNSTENGRIYWFYWLLKKKEALVGKSVEKWDKMLFMLYICGFIQF